MSLQEKLKLLDKLSDHYSEHQHNILENYKNQLAIYIGVENVSRKYYETLLQPELVLHKLYEPIYNEGEDFINEMESLKFEHDQYIKKFDADKVKGIENIDLLKGKLQQFLKESKKLQQKNNWQFTKSKIHDLIFKEKLTNNNLKVKPIKAILNTTFFEEIDKLPVEQSIQKELDAYVKVVPLYNQIILDNNNCKPLKDVVETINKSEILNTKPYYFFVNKESINDFLYLWKIKILDHTDISNQKFKIANTNNLLYYINNGGWSDTVIINKDQNEMLVSDEILVLNATKINHNYLLLLLNLPCYREMAHYNYKRLNNKNAILDFPIPIPTLDVQNYFSDAVEKYFYFNNKNLDINKIIIETEDILKEQGEVAANYFIDMKINEVKKQ